MSLRMEKRKEEDERMQLLIGRALLAGVLLSTAVMLLGLILSAAGMTAPLSHGISIVDVFLMLDPRDGTSVLLLGIALLLLTPVLRVVLAVVSFVRERDWRFALVSLGVLVILLISMFFVKG